MTQCTMNSYARHMATLKATRSTSSLLIWRTTISMTHASIKVMPRLEEEHAHKVEAPTKCISPYSRYGVRNRPASAPLRQLH